jgi:DNA-binding Lrp family transcriptional regulator
MIATYVLVQISATDPGKVVEKLRQIEGVKQAHVTAGPVDCIALIEGTDLNALKASVLAIRAVEGVEKTDSRLVVA